MTFRHLQAFRAIVLVGTMVEAAELLGISQPTISRLIAQLENSLSLTLFDRSLGRLILTPEGEMIYGAVEHAFVAIDRIGEFAKEIKDVQAGSLSIGCLPTLASSFLPGVIAEFSKEHPLVSVSLNIQSSTKIEDWIRNQQMDIGLAQLPVAREDFLLEEFCSLPYYAIVPKAHPYVGRTMLSPANFEGQPFVSLTKSSNARHQMDRLFADHNVKRVLRIEVSHMSLIADLVGSGLGLSIMDPFSVAAALDKPIKALFLKPSIDFKIGLIYPSRRPLSRAGRSFVKVLKKMRERQLANVRVAVGRDSNLHPVDTGVEKFVKSSPQGNET